MEPKIIGVKQLYRELPKIARAAKRGQSFLVVKHATPLFRIEPILPARPKKYTLKDFEKIQFRGGDPDLSKNIDKILYGVKRLNRAMRHRP